jgi:glutamine amidotransferase
VPHIGWNSVSWSDEESDDPFLKGIAGGNDFYFVHSFYPVPKNPRCALATTEYAGTTFTSILRYENMIATQFHPEKSGKTGLQLLANFCAG